MVDSVVTKQELIDAQKDAQSLEDVINGPADTRVKPRIGPEMWTLATINSLVQQGQIKISDLSEAIQIALAAGAGSAGWTANLVADGNQTQKEINLFGGKKYDMPVGGYPLGAVVRLDNGDIVKSTVPNNTTNPNVDMTGWKFNDNTVESIASLISFQSPKNKQLLNVLSYNPPVIGASAFYGGGLFRYEPTITVADNVISFKSSNVAGCWVRVLDTDYLTFEMAGADGVGDERQVLSAVMRVASRLKMKIKGVAGRTYTIGSFDSTDYANIAIRSESYLDLDLNGSTIKVANNLGDYLYLICLVGYHEKACIYNGTIDQNSMNNPPIENITSDKNGRVLFGNFNITGGLFKVNDIVAKDVLGNWQFICHKIDRCEYYGNTIVNSPVSSVHTDRTSLYIIAKESYVYQNSFKGDIFGNATTAVELHSSNSWMYRNTVDGYRSAVFVVGDNQDTFTTEMTNIHVYENKFTNVQDGVFIWTETGTADKNYDGIYIDKNNILLNTRRLTSLTNLQRATGIGTIREGWKSQSVKNLNITGNTIRLVKNAENNSTTMEALIALYSTAEAPSFAVDTWNITGNTLDNPIDSAILIGTSGNGTQLHLHDRVNIGGNIFKNLGSAHAIKFNNLNLIRKSIISGNDYGETGVPIGIYTTGVYAGVNTGLMISELTLAMLTLQSSVLLGAELFAHARGLSLAQLQVIEATRGSQVRIGVNTYTQTAEDTRSPNWS